MYNRFMKILEGIREDKKLLPCPPDFGWYWGGGVWVNPLKTIILIFTMLHLKKKNKEKHLQISLLYTCVPKILIIWSAVPEIYSATDWNW